MNPSLRRLLPFAVVLAVVLLVTATAATTNAVVRARPDAAGSTTAAQLREIERTRLRALVDADADAMQRLHADDFEFVNPIGETETRNGYLGAITAGDIDYLVFKPASRIHVRMYGQAAVLRYTSDLDIVGDGLGRLTHQARHTDL